MAKCERSLYRVVFSGFWIHIKERLCLCRDASHDVMRFRSVTCWSWCSLPFTDVLFHSTDMSPLSSHVHLICVLSNEKDHSKCMKVKNKKDSLSGSQVDKKKYLGFLNIWISSGWTWLPGGSLGCHGDVCRICLLGAVHVCKKKWFTNAQL